MTWPNIIAALAIALLKFAIERGATPSTLEDVKTPENIRTAWADYLRERLRGKPDGRD